MLKISKKNVIPNFDVKSKYSIDLLPYVFKLQFLGAAGFCDKAIVGDGSKLKIPKLGSQILIPIPSPTIPWSESLCLEPFFTCQTTNSLQALCRRTRSSVYHLVGNLWNSSFNWLPTQYPNIYGPYRYPIIPQVLLNLLPLDSHSAHSWSLFDIGFQCSVQNLYGFICQSISAQIQRPPEGEIK